MIRLSVVLALPSGSLGTRFGLFLAVYKYHTHYCNARYLNMCRCLSALYSKWSWALTTEGVFSCLRRVCRWSEGAGDVQYYFQNTRHCFKLHDKRLYFISIWCFNISSLTFNPCSPRIENFGLKGDSNPMLRSSNVQASYPYTSRLNTGQP